MILQGDVLQRLAEIPTASVDCIVTSPPYWGLRDYKVEPSIWGGRPNCRHRWEPFTKPAANGIRNGAMQGETLSATSSTRSPSDSAFCSRCGAWRGCYGLEPTLQLYVDNTVRIFAELHRVLKKTGTLWLNIGDAYAASGAVGSQMGKQKSNRGSVHKPGRRNGASGLKHKDLCGIPWRIAFALQDYGWYLRSEIVWSKPNPMPQSCLDRPTVSHEQLFLFSKNGRRPLLWRARDTGEWSWVKPDKTETVVEHGKVKKRWRGFDYYYDADAIRTKLAADSLPRLDRAHSGYAPDGQHEHCGILAPRTGYRTPTGWDQEGGGLSAFHRDGRRPQSSTLEGTYAGRHQEGLMPDGQTRRNTFARPSKSEPERPKGMAPNRADRPPVDYGNRGANARTVWVIPTVGFPGAHFATFPPELPRRCILAGCPEGGTVLDPFAGSGTTYVVSIDLGRKGIAIELNPSYVGIIQERATKVTPSLFVEVA